MIIVFFNQNYTTMNLIEAKHLITTAPDKDTAIRIYLECWKQLYKREDKVKLEKWWHNNHNQLKFYYDGSNIAESGRELHTLELTPDEQKECEAEIDQWERDLTTAEIDLFMQERLN